MQNLIDAAKEFLAGDMDEDGFCACVHFFVSDCSNDELKLFAELLTKDTSDANAVR